MTTMRSRLFLYRVLRANGHSTLEAAFNVVRAALGGKAYYHPIKNRRSMLRFRERK
jgi:hypothetical protein